MSLRENQLTDQTAVLNEWIGRYSALKPYAKSGVLRQLTANSLSGFNPPFGAVQTSIDETFWGSLRRTLLGSKQPNNNVPAQDKLASQLARKPPPPIRYSLTQHPETRIKPTLRALQKGQKGGPSATSSISLYIAWEQDGAARPPNWKCAFKLITPQRRDPLCHMSKIRAYSSACLTSGPTFATQRQWKRTLSASDFGPMSRNQKRFSCQFISNHYYRRGGSRTWHSAKQT